MALRGTLEDINIVDLIQYPNGAKRTGQMAITSPEGEANLFYIDGMLVHAEHGDAVGFDVVVDVVDWQEGEFEFRTGVEPPDETIRGSLIHVVMEALKVRDEERKQEDRRPSARIDPELGQLKEAFGVDEDVDPSLFRAIVGFLGDHSVVRHVSVLNAEGDVSARASVRGNVPPDLDELHGCVTALLDAYPREGLSRVVLQDEEGVAVINRVNDLTVLAVAEESVTVGAISIAVNKLATALEDGAVTPTQPAKRRRRRRPTFAVSRS